MYSEIVNGKVLDFHYKPMTVHNGYIFYVGHIYIGQIFYIGKAWTAVSAFPCPLCPISGFKTRHKAAELLLEIRRQSKV